MFIESFQKHHKYKGWFYYRERRVFLRWDDLMRVYEDPKWFYVLVVYSPGLPEKEDPADGSFRMGKESNEERLKKFMARTPREVVKEIGNRENNKKQYKRIDILATKESNEVYK